VSEMTLEEVVAEQRRTDDAFKGDVLEVNCGGYRQLLALARRALEQAARDEVNDAFLAKVDAALEQPVPTGEVTREHREAVARFHEGDFHPDSAIGYWVERGFSNIASLRDGWGRQALLLAAREQAEWLLGQPNARHEIACALKAEHDHGKRLGRESAQGGWVAGSPPHVALWDAINRYAVTCGGEPSKYVHGNTLRQRAVADVENKLRLEQAERCVCCGAEGNEPHAPGAACWPAVGPFEHREHSPTDGAQGGWVAVEDVKTKSGDLVVIHQPGKPPLLREMEGELRGPDGVLVFKLPPPPSDPSKGGQ
jgi:hypothetical protein